MVDGDDDGGTRRVVTMINMRFAMCIRIGVVISFDTQPFLKLRSRSLDLDYHGATFPFPFTRGSDGVEVCTSQVPAFMQMSAQVC